MITKTATGTRRTCSMPRSLTMRLDGTIKVPAILQQTKTTAHEAYGHAFFYETKNQNIEAACHTYTIVDGGSYYDEDYDMEIPILKQVPTNIELELQIENVVNEAEFNYKEHNE